MSATLDFSAQVRPQTIAPPSLDLSRLPDPDYARHPAYGQMFRPGFKDSIQACLKLIPWMGLVAGKRLLLVDRIPALPKYSGHLKGGLVGRLFALPRYLPYIFKTLFENLVGFFGGNKPVTPAAFQGLADGFCRTGFAYDRLTSEEKAQVESLLVGPIDELRAARTAAGKRTFEGNTRFFNTRDHKALFDTLNAHLEKHGMLAAASQYIGRPSRLVHLLVQINDPQDKFYYGTFKDINLPDSKTNYMHVDTSYDMVKCVIYLNEVNQENGPFSYVLGSHKIKPVGFEGIVRRAVDRSGLSGFSPASRKIFYALPKLLRRKCTFGADMIDGTPEQTAVLQSEYYFKSEDGDLGLFANNGLHRGGLTKSGERRVLFGVIA